MEGLVSTAAKVDFVAIGESIGGHMGVNSLVVTTAFRAHTVIGVDRGAITNGNNLVAT